MKEKTCCFTGHRNMTQADIPIVFERTKTYISDLVNNGVRFFGVGGAIGYDTLAAKMLFELRKTKFPSIKVILVYPFEGFTSRWALSQKADYDLLLPQYDKVVCVSDRACRESYLARDRHLVNGSAYCIAYCTRSYGGTAYTIRYAKCRGLSILNTADYDIGIL